jgi:hypothetical protein
MSPFARQFFVSLVRHGLTMTGGIGLVTDAQINDVVSATLLIAGVAWSAYNTWQKTRPISVPVRLVSPRNRPVGKKAQ